MGDSVSSLHARFGHRASLQPDVIALVDGSDRFTYADVEGLSNRVARTLVSLPLAPGALVGVSMRRSWGVVVAIMGILKAGCAYVALDPSYPEARRKFMASDSQLRVAISDEAGTDLGPDVDTLSLDDCLAGADARTDRSRSPEEALAYVLYTSGSTGTPKGVCISHRNVLSLLEAATPLFDFGPSDVWPLFHSYSFDVSVWEMWSCLLSGGKLVIVDEATVSNPRLFLGLLREQGATVLNQVPSVFRYLVDEVERTGVIPDRLRVVILAGEPLHFGAARRWLDLGWRIPPQLVNMYGTTETTIHATHKRLEKSDLIAGSGPTPIGAPLAHLSFSLVDEAGIPVASGEVSEIRISGAGVARGYLHRDELTRERFVMTEQGWSYKTGDLARLGRGGELEYVGRADTQVKIRGHRIELGEIENHLMSHPDVDQAVVVVQESPRSEAMLVCHYTERSGLEDPLSTRELRRFLSGRIPRYMVPVDFFPMRSLPLTPSGKLDRERLTRQTPGPGFET